MNARIRAWLDAKREAAAAMKHASRLERLAHLEPLPKKLRPARSEDVVVGAILWYKRGDAGHFWQMVDEVLHPDDAFKAYVAADGCRYGLDGAFVEVEK